MKKPHSVTPLERMLGVWELEHWSHELTLSNPGLLDLSYLSKLDSGHLEDIARICKSWRTLRTHLLEIPISGFDFKKYMPSGDFLAKSVSEMGFKMTPAFLASWIMSSKRVFTLDKELQQLLALTGNQDVRWDMLNLPFDSFLINLPQPVYCKELHQDGGISITSMLVTHESTFIDGLVDKRRHISLMGNNYSTLSDLSVAERRKMSKLAQSNPGKFGEKINRLQHKQVIGTINLPENMEENSEIDWDSITGDNPGFKSCLDIFFGFVCYLNTLPKPVSVIDDRWQSVEKTERTPNSHNATTSNAQVLSVYYGQNLSAEEKLSLQSLSEGNREVSAHWRRGHFRRAAGSGSNPLAAKSIWVRPTLVRRDKLKDSGVLSGSEQSVQ